MRSAATYLVVLVALSLFSACEASEVSRRLGAQCDTRSDCDDRCLSGPEFPDGLCTVTCETDLDCPSFARCIDLEGGVCLYRCQLEPDCDLLGTGWSCRGEVRREMINEEVPVCIGR